LELPHVFELLLPTLFICAGMLLLNVGVDEILLLDALAMMLLDHLLIVQIEIVLTLLVLFLNPFFETPLPFIFLHLQNVVSKLVLFEPRLFSNFLL